MNIKRLKNRVLRELYSPFKKEFFDPNRIVRTFNDMERVLSRQSMEIRGGHRKIDESVEKEEEEKKED